MAQDKRYAQANKEALLSLAVYAVYFVWWYATAYGLGEGNPDEYRYVCGFPEWFFYSSIVGYPLITLVLWAVVRFGFKNMPLGEYEDGSDDESNDEVQGSAQGNLTQSHSIQKSKDA